MMRSSDEGVVMALFFYTLLWYLLMPFLWVYLWVRGGKAPEYRKRWSERLVRNQPQGQLPYCVWVHAVSVGETLAAAPMIKAFIEQYPETPILVTTTTPTGSARVKALFGHRVHHVYCPWDVPSAWRRFFAAYQPRLALIVETELWPNLMATAKRLEVPVWLVNGRISQQSYLGYRRLRAITTPAIQVYDGMLVQTKEEAQRYIGLGADPAKVHVTGSIKFDLRLTEAMKQKAIQQREAFGQRPVWVAASTHEGEEEAVLRAHKEVLAALPEALLVLVPRHPERFDGIADLIERQGLSFCRRSRGEEPTTETQVYLGDSMGELLMLYGAADLAFVGGSFADVGGHNLLEPAAWEHPVLSGPVLYNFERIAELLEEAGALTLVQNSRELAQEVTALFADPKRREREGEAAARVVAAHGGALQKTLDQLSRVWPCAASSRST